MVITIPVSDKLKSRNLIHTVVTIRFQKAAYVYCLEWIFTCLFVFLLLFSSDSKSVFLQTEHMYRKMYMTLTSFSGITAAHPYLPGRKKKQRKKESTAIKKQGDKLLLLPFETKAFIHPSTSLHYLLSYFRTSLLMQLKNRLLIPSNSSNLLSIPYITFSYAAVSVTSAIHSLSNSPAASSQVLSISCEHHETKGDMSGSLAAIFRLHIFK